MARHAHPSSHGRLILRSLVDSALPAEPSGELLRGPIEAPAADQPSAAQANRKVHPGQGGLAPLGPTPGRSDAPRLPSTLPHVAHVGQPERSVKPPRSSAPRETGRIGSGLRPKR
ncbi:MAG TPA: hypothetical protein VHY91_03385 [Pirellulales bacterium]|nr:hypothetical protein [Pirellulales bacterium]